MGKYKARQQCDRICADCEWYSKDLFEDSFGPYIEESCSKGHYKRVKQFAEACRDFRRSNGHMQDLSLDDLSMDVLAAQKAGMSYGQWKARHPDTKWDYEAARTEAMLAKKNKED